MTNRDTSEINVLWSSSSLIAVSKPAGIATQSPPGVDSLETRLRIQLASQTEYLAFPHRLDRPVSGVILVATTKRAANLLGAQFESRKVSKTYIACVSGNAANVELVWNDSILKRECEAKADVVDAGPDGAKDGETVVEMLGYDVHND